MSEEVFRNEVPGNEGTNVYKSSLTDEEIVLKAKVAECLHIINKAEQAKHELVVLRDSCKHHAFYDMAGFPNDLRFCSVCSTFMGRI
jgi:hypothetical protein